MNYSKLTKYIGATVGIVLCSSCAIFKPNYSNIKVYETSADGNKLTPLENFVEHSSISTISIDPSKQYQTITGFGGAFTESSAYLLNKLSKENRDKIINAYFSKEGANYSLTRTHMNSCDFSLNQYSYTPVEDDLELKSFSVEEDKDDLIPMIQDALKASEDGFKIVASPWTAPPWMKDNKEWVGGKLLPKYYDSWALFFSKYANAYAEEGINIWGFTVENEPNGNGNNWESMHYTPEEMTEFVQKHLGPTLEKNNQSGLKILGYDQNRLDLPEWVDAMYATAETSKYFDGTAIHWYESTYDFFSKELQYAHTKAPNKYLIETEGCIDSEVPAWQDDAWYWSKEATDWGYDWRPQELKYLHPKYAPVNRYARDIIGCLNNWVDGWIDWNMVLNKQGGPNWFKNWCAAPVIVDEDNDEVYLTPLYYTMAHFSKYIRPGAKVIDAKSTDEKLMSVAAQNPDGSISLVVFNEFEEGKTFYVDINGIQKVVSISPKAIQTILINKK